MKLEPGTHRIVAKAETAKSYGLSEPMEVIYAPQQPELPTLYVLSIGVSAYENKELRLGYGAIDAQSVAEVLKKGGSRLFRKVEERVLTDTRATRREILKGLEWMKSQMTQRDVGLVFFAGHGAKDVNGVFYLVPVECDPEELSVSGVSEDQIKRYCQSIPGRLILLLDACHTGAMGGDKRRSLEGLTDNLVRDLVTDDYGVTVMCSAMGREYAQEEESWGHGAFTLALIEGLQGKADYDHDGTVYLNELDLYVAERVKGLTGGAQHPVTQKPTTMRSFPLTKAQGPSQPHARGIPPLREKPAFLPSSPANATVVRRPDSQTARMTVGNKEPQYTVVKVYYATDRTPLDVFLWRQSLRRGWPWLTGVVALIAVALMRWRRRSRRFVVRGLAWATLTATVVLAGLTIVYSLQPEPTDRKIDRMYGNGRGDLELGTCEVSVPKDHQTGELESPTVLRLEFREDPERHVVLMGVHPESAPTFYADLPRASTNRHVRKRLFSSMDTTWDSKRLSGGQPKSPTI